MRKEDEHIIVGIDPGSLRTGYSVLALRDSVLTPLRFDVIDVSKEKDMSVRLRTIYNVLRDVMRKFKPTAAAVESAFYGKNAQSAFKIGLVRGVAILAAAEANIPVAEYSPRTVKKSIVGTGAATKEQVHYMVTRLTGARLAKAAFDVSDAFAVALCHINHMSPVRTLSRRPTDGLSKISRVQRNRSTSQTWEDFIRAHPERVIIK